MISLIGMPGVGKSTLGLSLSRNLSVPFVDTDAVFEAKTGSSILKYFSEHGEPAFREIESLILDEATQAKDGVISTGGGIVLSHKNREVLSTRTLVFYLQASPEYLYKRLRNDFRRPLLQGHDPLGKLIDMYRIRDPLYRLVSDFTVNIHGQRIEDTLAKVLSKLTPSTL